MGLVDEQKAYGIDIFDDQSKNLDNSGRGVRSIIEGHLRSFGIGSSQVVIDGRASDIVKAEDILSNVGSIRFFSIDGGHWRNVVINDLELAENVLMEGGVIALDDFLRPEWPDVSVGFFDWYERSEKNIVPFSIGFNKLYLCHKQCVLDLQNKLENSGFLKYFLSKYYIFYGNKIPIFQTYQLPEWGMRRRIEEYLKLYHPDFYVLLQNFRRD